MVRETDTRNNFSILIHSAALIPHIEYYNENTHAYICIMCYNLHKLHIDAYVQNGYKKYKLYMYSVVMLCSLIKIRKGVALGFKTD